MNYFIDHHPIMAALALLLAFILLYDIASMVNNTIRRINKKEESQ